MTPTSARTAVAPAAVELTDFERDSLAATAGELAGSVPGLIDDPRWLDAVREAAAALPGRLAAGLRAFRHDAGPDGVLLVRNLPVTGPEGPPLPPTPCVAGSVERRATTAAAVVTMMMTHLGEVIAYRSEKSGALVQNVVPVPGKEKQQSNAGSVLLEMHVENAFHANRPDFLGLLCVREDPAGRARLRTASVRRALPLLPDEVRRVLSEPRFLTEAPPSFESSGGVAPAHAVLRGDPADPDILVDFAATHPLDDTAGEALRVLREALHRAAVSWALSAGDLAVADNRLTVHGRTPFAPRYDGTDRWLHRVYAHLDNRRTRPDRPGGGSVLN